MIDNSRRDELIEMAKKMDDITRELTNEEYGFVSRIAQGIRQPKTEDPNRPAPSRTVPSKA